MMLRLMLALAVLLAFLPMRLDAREAASCSVSDATLAYPNRTGYYVSASVPVNAVVYSVVTGAGAPSNEWTAIPQSFKGGFNGSFVTTLFTQPGLVTLSIIDFRKGAQNNVLATCAFTVLP